MSRKIRRNKQAIVERAYRAGNTGSMGIQGDYSKYAGGSSVTIPTQVLAQMLQSMAPQKNQAQDFAPGSPLQPYQGVVPLGGPRQFSYNVGINLNNNDRTMGKPDIPSFEQLRLLAMLYDGIAMCERVILDMIPKLEPKVSLRKDMAEDGAEEKNYQSRIRTWMNFLEMPSPAQQLDIHSWLRMAWTEQTQIDALAMFKHKNRGGGLYGLEIIDGASVKPILDERGMVPLANQGFPAYQQYPYGVPGDLYTTDTMLYYRESPRAFTPYGFSRVERIITRVNQALRKEQYNLAQFTEGNLPAGIMEVPDSSQWTPDQIDSFEQLWNALMAGNVQQQARIKFTQPGMKYTQFANPVNGDHVTEFDEFLLNVAAACYGLSMGDLAFTGDIHKSSGDSQQNMMFRRTLAPLVTVYSRILTKVLRESFGDDELEVSFGGYDEAEDLVAQSTAYGGFVDRGILSRAAAARLMNFPEIPETGPFILQQGSPPLFLDTLADPSYRKAQTASQMAGFQFTTQNDAAGEKQLAAAGSSSSGGAGDSSGQDTSNSEDSEGDTEMEQGLSEADQSLSDLGSGSKKASRFAGPSLVEQQIAELLARVEMIERADPVRGPNGEFGFFAGKKQPTGHHKTGTHKAKGKGTHKGPKVSQKQRLTTRTQKLAARFEKLEARKLSKKWSAAQAAAAGKLGDIFAQIAHSIASGNSSKTDSLLDSAYSAAKTVFAGNSKGMQAMSRALTSIDNANDKGIRAAMPDLADDGDEDEEEETFGDLDNELDLIEQEDEAEESRVVSVLASIDEQLREIRALNVTPIEEDYFEQGSQEDDEDLPQRMAPRARAVAQAIARDEPREAAGDGEVDYQRGTSETERALSAEYRRWKSRAIADVKAGKQQRAFVSSLISPDAHHSLSQDLDAAQTIEDVRAAFDRAREGEQRPLAAASTAGSSSGGNPQQSNPAWKLRW